MVKRGLIWVAGVLVVLVALVCPAPDANAVPGLCEHRGFDHIQRHGGHVVDDAFHREHHEPVTCDDKPDGKRKPDERPDEQRHEAGHDDHHNDDHNDHCIGRCNRDHAWWH